MFNNIFNNMFLNNIENNRFFNRIETLRYVLDEYKSFDRFDKKIDQAVLLKTIDSFYQVIPIVFYN